jgi:hypothetical protein
MHLFRMNFKQVKFMSTFQIKVSPSTTNLKNVYLITKFVKWYIVVFILPRA